MANILHSTLTGNELHESKGVATAAEGTVYAANGTGSGVWSHTINNTHGQMCIIANTTAKALTGGVLTSDASYVKMTGVGFPWVQDYAHGVSVSTDKFILTQPGYYIVSFWGTFLIATNNAFIGVKWALNDTAPYSTQRLVARASAAGDYKSVSATAIIGPVNANDTLSMYIASDTSGNVTLQDSGVMVAYVHP